MALYEHIQSILILALIVLYFYTKMRKQTFKDTIEEAKDTFGLNEGDDE